MPEPRRFGAAAFAQLALALSAAWALMAAAQGVPAFEGTLFRAAARLSALVFLVAFFVPLRIRPGRTARWLERLTWLLVGAVGTYGFAWSIYPVVPETIVRTFPRLAAYLLVPLLAVLLASRSTLAAHRGLIPCAVALLVLAAFDTGAALREPFVGAGAALFALLALDVRAQGLLGRLLRLTLHAALAAALAFGLTWLLPWAQPRVEAFIARSLETSGTLATTGFSLESNLGSAEELMLSPRVLMNVETRRPTKLRAAVFVRFDGRRWELTPTTDVPVDCPPPGLDEGSAAWLAETPGTTCGDTAHLLAAGSASLVRTRVIEVARVVGALPVPNVAVVVRRAGSVTLNNYQLAGPPGLSLETYGVLSHPAPADAHLPRQSERAALEVPPETADGLRELASRLASEGSTPEARVAATVAFLQREYRYSLTPGRFRTRQPVVEFLLEKKRGYCEYFASAAALLLRLQGVPTRYVRGFTVREANRVADRYVVREADAHAWIEALLPGRGWLEVDPTPADQYAAAHGSIRHNRLTTLGLWLAGRFAELRAYLGAGDWRAARRRLVLEGRRLAAWCLGDGRLVSGSLLAVILALMAWRRGLLDRWLRPRLSRPVLPDDLAPELRELMASLEASWQRHGRPRPSARAWREHLSGLPPDALPGPVRVASERAVDCLYRTRYAGTPLPSEELRAAREALERSGSV